MDREWNTFQGITYWFLEILELELKKKEITVNNGMEKFLYLLGKRGNLKNVLSFRVLLDQKTVGKKQEITVKRE